MEDFEKIQYREHQRQEFLDGLKKMVRNQIFNEEIEGEANEFVFYWGLIAGLTRYVHDFLLGVSAGKDDLFVMSALNFLYTSVLPKIEAFTPVSAERNFLAAELLKYSVEELFRPVHQEILRLSVPPARDKFLKQIGFGSLEVS